jgi:malonyl CoA-acyl carrier protein transacylase
VAADLVFLFPGQGSQRVALELGPGRVLTGLSRQTAPDLKAFAADSIDKLRTALDMLAGG